MYLLDETWRKTHSKHYHVLRYKQRRQTPRKTPLHQPINKSLPRVEHIPFRRQVSHRLRSHAALLLAPADI